MNYKSILTKLVALCVSVTVSAVVLTQPAQYFETAGATTVAELESQKKANQKKIADAETKLKNLQGDIAKQEQYQAELLDQINLINDNILLVDTQLQSIRNDMAQKQTDITNLEATIAQQQVDIDAGLEQFKQRLRAMYINGNDSLASALVGSTDFYDMLAKVDLIARVAKHDDDLITNLMKQLEEFNQNKTDLAAQLNALSIKETEQESVKAEYDAAVQDLNDKMAQTTEIKAQIQQQQSELQSDIDAAKAKNEEISKEQDAIAEAARKAAEAARKKQEAEAAAKKQQTTAQQKPSSGSSGTTSNPTYTGGTFSWPVPGHYYISSPYGWRWGSLHAGIDIAGGGISGSAVTAAGSGSVSLVRGGCTHNNPKNYSCGCNSGYGNYVMIDHGNGYSTLYAHLASINVSVGQSISTGQTLGTVGSTGWSTGYHLHFSVLKNGSYVDPAPYLGR